MQVINVEPHGYNPASQAQQNDAGNATDENPDNTKREFNKFVYPPDYPAFKSLLIDHFSIIGVVEDDWVNVITK